MNQTWYYMTETGSGFAETLLLNGTHIGQGKDTDELGPISSYAYLGTDAGAANFMYGMQDELRLSDIIRSDAWLKASYYSGIQPNSFITWGEMQAPSVGTNDTTGTGGKTFATFNGYLTKNGNAATTYGFRYGTDADNLTTNTTVGVGIANGTTFNYAATGLTEGTAYFVQAWAGNSNGFSQGNIKAFWTNSTWANATTANRTRIIINHTFID